jgi:ribonuclease P protein component
MLPKKRRIPRKEFPFILKNGRRFSSYHILLYIAKNPVPEQSRFSFSISKKIFKRAVDRNKYRRRGYSIISKHLNQINSGYLFFFSFKRGKYPIEFPELGIEIVSLLSLAGVLI